MGLLITKGDFSFWQDASRTLVARFLRGTLDVMSDEFKFYGFNYT